MSNPRFPGVNQFSTNLFGKKVKMKEGIEDSLIGFHLPKESSISSDKLVEFEKPPNPNDPNPVQTTRYQARIISIENERFSFYADEFFNMYDLVLDEDQPHGTHLHGS